MFLLPILFLRGPQPESRSQKTYQIKGERVKMQDVPPASFAKAEQVLKADLETEEKKEGCTLSVEPLASAPVWKVDYGYKYLLSYSRDCVAGSDDVSKKYPMIMMVFDDERRGTSMVVDFDPESNVRLNRIGAPVIPDSSFGDRDRPKKKAEGSLYFEDAKKIEAERGDKEYIKVLKYGNSAPVHVRFVRFVQKGATPVENGEGFATHSPTVVVESADGMKTMSIWPLCDPEVVSGCVTSVEFVSEPPPEPSAGFPEEPYRRPKLPYEPEQGGASEA